MNSFFGGFIKAAQMRQVAAVAVMHDGKMLMGKRRDNHKWTQPGGHIEAGEAPKDGAVREVMEEAGIMADPADMEHLLTKTIKKPSGERIKVHAFKLDLDEKPRTTMKNDPDKEVFSWSWTDLNNLPKEVLSRLHVPAKDNVLFKALGLKDFFTGPEYSDLYSENKVKGRTI